MRYAQRIRPGGAHAHGMSTMTKDAAGVSPAGSAPGDAHDSTTALDSIPGLVGLLTAGGEIQFVNRRVLEYTGRTQEELRYGRRATSCTQRIFLRSSRSFTIDRLRVPTRSSSDYGVRMASTAGSNTVAFHFVTPLATLFGGACC